MDINTQSVAPKDMDAMLSVDEFVRWFGKEPNATTRRWAIRMARRKAVPAAKIGKEYFFHPRTVLTKCTAK